RCPVSLGAGICFLRGAVGRRRVGLRLVVRRGLSLALVTLGLLFLAGALVVGDVEAAALEDEPRPARDLPLRLLAAGGTLHTATVVHRRVELLEAVPG